MNIKNKNRTLLREREKKYTGGRKKLNKLKLKCCKMPHEFLLLLLLLCLDTLKHCWRTTFAKSGYSSRCDFSILPNDFEWMLDTSCVCCVFFFLGLSFFCYLFCVVVFSSSLSRLSVFACHVRVPNSVCLTLIWLQIRKFECSLSWFTSSIRFRKLNLLIGR